jgi:hypothetical protein
MRKDVGRWRKEVKIAPVISESNMIQERTC